MSFLSGLGVTLGGWCPPAATLGPQRVTTDAGLSLHSLTLLRDRIQDNFNPTLRPKGLQQGPKSLLKVRRLCMPCSSLLDSTLPLLWTKRKAGLAVAGWHVRLAPGHHHHEHEGRQRAVRRVDSSKLINPANADRGREEGGVGSWHTPT